MPSPTPEQGASRAFAARVSWLAPVAASAVLAAGCGSSNKSTTTAPAPAAAQGPPSTQGPYSSSPGNPSSAGAGEGASAVTVTTKANRLGTVVAAGPKHLTVYLFEADKGSTSSCTGACAAVWPPVRTSGAIAAGGGVDTAKLSRIARADGTKQVSYNGHPLYFYARDGDKSDAYGQGLKSFGASWYVLAASGSKIDKS